jgi:hypothetical protein
MGPEVAGGEAAAAGFRLRDSPTSSTAARMIAAPMPLVRSNDSPTTVTPSSTAITGLI